MLDCRGAPNETAQYFVLYRRDALGERWWRKEKNGHARSRTDDARGAHVYETLEAARNAAGNGWDAWAIAVRPAQRYVP